MVVHDEITCLCYADGFCSPASSVDSGTLYLTLYKFENESKTVIYKLIYHTPIDTGN